MESQVASPAMKKFLILLISSVLLFTSNCAGPLIIRLYFIYGGSRIWLSSSLITAGFPFTLIYLIIAYFHRRKSDGPDTKIMLMSSQIFIASLISGLITGLDNYLYAYGSAKLPVSTSSLLLSTQLVFTAVFAFLLVKQKFTAYSINSIVLLTIGAGVLALGANSDRPRGESTKAYNVGFIMTLLAAIFYGFVLPFNEVSFRKTKQAIELTMLLEFQTIMCLFATTFSVTGMLINKDFQAIAREAKQFELGEGRYYMVLASSALVWQIFFVGAIGVTCYVSALLSGILIAASLSVTEVLAVIFFHEKFGGEKGVSVALCLWGFVSYFYGETRQTKKHEKKMNINIEAEITQSPPI